jgi:hypothetical protein
MLSKEVMEQSLFIRDWINDNVEYFKLMNPRVNETKLRERLMQIVQERLVNREAYLHNDYQDDMRIKADLLKLYDWFQQTKPIAAGNGTFFYNQDKKYCPIQNVIDGRISDRKKYQKIRDEYLGPNGETTDYYYQYNDMLQMEAKVMTNAIYGSFGARTFQLYNQYTAGSTTGTAQSLISTTAIAFEAFLADSVKFKSLGEMVTFLGNILVKDEHTMPLHGLKIYSDKEFVLNSLKKKFVRYNDFYTPVLRKFLAYRTPEELTRIYYANNLFALVENPLISERIKRIYDVTKSFRNPNNVPENIKEDLEFVWEYCSDLVFYNHAYTEQINRLKHDERGEVILIDTDSNVINIEPWIVWTKEHIWPITESSMGEEDMQFCSVNIIAYLVTRMARELLDRYAKDCHVLEKYHSRLNIKNEFYFPKVLLADVKKRYIAHIRLKEGKQVNKIELKGHDFKKAGSSQHIEDRIMGIIKRDIIDPAEINVIQLMRDVSALEQEIRDSLTNRERTFLVRMNCKVMKVYAEPYSMGAYLGPMLWNLIYPDNMINIPDKCDIVFLSIPNEKVLEEKLGTKYPKIANIIKKTFFESGIKQLQTNGVKYLALPNDGSKIPEWVLEVMDTERIVTRNAGTFYPVLKALTFTTIVAGDFEYTSNILNI